MACLVTSHEAGEMALLLKCLCIWGLSQMVVHTYNSSAGEVETGGPLGRDNQSV